MAEDKFDIAALESAARGGDADAQYRMAALAISQSQVDDGLAWLRKAAANNHLDARFTLANFYLRGELLKQDVPRAITLVEQLHRGKYAAASQQLASMKANGFGMERDWAGALDILLDSATEGRVGAMRELALLLILSDIENELSFALLMAAATRSDIHAAMILATRRANGDTRADEAVMGFFLEGAKQLGYPSAAVLQEKMAIPVSEDVPAIAAIPTFDQKALKIQLLKPEGISNVTVKTLIDRPVIHIAEYAIPPEICAYIIGYAAPNLQPAAWFNPEKSEWEADPLKQCMTRLFLPIDQPFSITAVTARLAHIAGKSILNAEIPSANYFRPGQQFLPHLEVMPEDLAASPIEQSRGGQRVKALQLFLNDDYEGGECHFSRADYAVEPKTGAVMTYETTLVDGAIDEQALMEEKEVKAGDKWTLTMSLRDGEFTFIYAGS